MKPAFTKILLLIIVVGLSMVFFRGRNNAPAKSTISVSVGPTSVTSLEPSSTQATVSSQEFSSVEFVPYWTMNADITAENVERLLYFGIAANKNGINKVDPGYANLSKFVNIVGDSKKTYLTLRMLDTESNIAILENKAMQEKIITETIVLAQENGFEGVVLDLELSILPVSDMQEAINGFVERFYAQTRKTDVKFATAIYGDVFYRARPFDVKFIGKHSDEIMIMAYDFSKSYGEPGPNFPLAGNEKYGYDFKTMIDDYLQKVPAEKLTVIMGMFGYDWTLGPQGKPLKGASAVTLHQARARYINECNLVACKIERDSVSKETNVTFKDEAGNTHSVWFEDEQSVEEKKKFLQEKGIYSIGYWAYGYW